MPLPHLNPGDPELDLIQNAKDGICRDLGQRTVRAEVLRVLLIRTHDPAIPADFYEANCHRWRIKGAVFEECLNLDGGRLADGGALPSLEFIDCTFKQGFWADNAHLERLSFKNCNFGAPPCDPCGCTPDPSGGPCAQSAAPAAAGTTEESQPVQVRETAEAVEPSDAAGSKPVIAEDAAKATREHEAQIKKDNCKPETAGESQLSLRYARILGEFHLDQVCPLEKGGLLRVDARSARIGASVIVENSTLRAPRNVEFTTPHDTVYALNLRNADIHSDLFLEPKVETDGGLILFGAHIGGDIRAHGLIAKDGYDDGSRQGRNALKQKRYAISLQSARIDGNFYAGTLDQDRLFQVEGVFDLACIHVAGNLELRQALVDPKDDPKYDPKDREPAINLRGAFVGGRLKLLNSRIWQGVQKPFRCEGKLLLDDAAVSGSLVVEGNLPVLTAINLSVTGDATISVHVDSLLDLSRATIDGRLDIRKLRVIGPGTGNPSRDNPAKRDEEVAEEREYKKRPKVLMVDADVKRSLTLGRYSQISYKSHRLAKPLCYSSVTIVEVSVEIYDIVAKIATFPTITFLLRDGSKPILLEGKSQVFHELNGQGLLKMDDDDRKKDYLRLFCAYVWGKYGPFQIIESNEQIPNKTKEGEDPPAITEIKVNEPDLAAGADPEHSDGTENWGKPVANFTANVLYSNALFEATFVLYQQGMVGMQDDEPVCEFDPDHLPAYDSPYTYAARRSAYRENMRQLIDLGELDALVPDWKAGFDRAQQITDFWNAVVDLSDASCGTLEDADGGAWGQKSLMNLTNFTYARISPPDEERPFTRQDTINRLSEDESNQHKRCINFVNEEKNQRFKAVVAHLQQNQREGQNRIRLRALRVWFRALGYLKNHGGRKLSEFVNGFEKVSIDLVVGTDPRARERVREARRARYSLRLLKARWPVLWWWFFWDEVRLAGRGRSVKSLSRPMYLRRQWLANRPLEKDFHPQPYVHLAQVLRNEGDEDSARKIEREKIDLEFDNSRYEARKHHRWLRWAGLCIWKPLYGRGFGYGLSVLRACITLVMFWLVGAGLVWDADRHQMLTKTEARVATTLTEPYPKPGKTASLPTAVPDSIQSPTPVVHTVHRRVYCKCAHRYYFIRHAGSHLSNPASGGKDTNQPQAPTSIMRTHAEDPLQIDANSLCERDINPFLYAVESATPILNLHQQSRCDIRTPDNKATWYCLNHVLQVSKLFYQAIGYLITSLAVLTFSGIARRWEQK